MRLRNFLPLSVCLSLLGCQGKTEEQKTAPLASSSAASAASAASVSPKSSASSVALTMASTPLPKDDDPPTLPTLSSATPKPKAAPRAVKNVPALSAAPVALTAPSAVAPLASSSVASAASAASAAPDSSAVAQPPANLQSDPAAMALAARSDAYYVPRPSLTTKFKQEFYVKSSGQKKNSAGMMLLQRPGKMSWRYDSPSRNRVVCDGVTITVYDGENQQYTRQPFANSEYPGALGFLTGDGILKHFVFTFHDKVNFPGGKVLIGRPVRPSPWYNSVLFYIDESTAHIRRVVIIDIQGNRNRYDFESLAEGPIDPAEFTWSPPEGSTQIKNQ